MPENPEQKDPGTPEDQETSWIEKIILNTSLLLAFIAGPGALVLMVYSIRNQFFPYLVANVSILQFISTSCVMAFVLTVGVVMSATSLIWIFVKRLDAWLTPGSFERRFYVIMSVILFVLILLFTLTNSLDHRDHSLVLLIFYFMITSFLQLCLLTLHGLQRRINWRLLLWALPLSLAPLIIVPQSIAPLLNIFMTTMGFRSDGQELILVDDDAEQLLQARAALYEHGPNECPVQVGDRRMWYLVDGVVIWRGPGDSVLVNSGQEGDGVVHLRPDQVLTAARRGALINCPS